MNDNRGAAFVISTLLAVGLLFLVTGLLSDGREWATVVGGVVIQFALAAWIAVRLDRRDEARRADPER